MQLRSVVVDGGKVGSAVRKRKDRCSSLTCAGACFSQTALASTSFLLVWQAVTSPRKYAIMTRSHRARTNKTSISHGSTRESGVHRGAQSRDRVRTVWNAWIVVRATGHVLFQICLYHPALSLPPLTSPLHRFLPILSSILPLHVSPQSFHGPNAAPTLLRPNSDLFNPFGLLRRLFKDP